MDFTVMCTAGSTAYTCSFLLPRVQIFVQLFKIKLLAKISNCKKLCGLEPFNLHIPTITIITNC